MDYLDLGSCTTSTALGVSVGKRAGIASREIDDFVLSEKPRGLVFWSEVQVGTMVSLSLPLPASNLSLRREVFLYAWMLQD